ncbi:ROK family transcriptional regulator [Ktedonospora formicarum]|uniref:Xylose repressor protein n=1 Tax=Ktedonospora formicarum TaxID=2778364 RepID=A0A8J3MSW5_9CHLR|nr:ROK family transcriptional regulator [Ktedonospora formicarum]GHO47532.1 xylose repressor protein [Ktedonospora formicarum]
MQPDTILTANKSLRDNNLHRLLNLIRLNGEISRPTLSTASGLSPATVLALTNKLSERGLIIEKGTANALRGRRPALLALNPADSYAIGLMIREYETVGSIINLHGSIIASLHWNLNLAEQSEHTIVCIGKLVEELISQNQVTCENIIGIGCAVSGYVDSQNGICVDSWQLGWHNFALGPLLSEYLHMPVLVSSNVSCISCYENLFGRGQTYQNFLTVALGRGLGLGIVLNGEMYSGSTGGAGEFGHTVAVVDGRRCECGNRGCLEEYVAHRGIIATYSELLQAGGFSQSEPTLEQLLQSPPDDQMASLALRKAGRLFGAGLANIVNLFNPECIIITGEGIEYGERFFDPTLQMLQEQAFSRLASSLPIILEPWSGYESWTRGAGALVLSQLLFTPAK